MKTQTKYIIDNKGRKKEVILDIKYYEKLLYSLEELSDKKAFLAVAKEESIPYSKIEARLKKEKIL
ncbi:MAG: hypothetical protein M1591_09280 [Deltaproteobacteria bacterium]|nr:hypothetical protein [Deltaproteobacteria bacterium]